MGDNLSESEELELLQLQKAKAMAMQGQSQDSSFPAGQIASQAGQAVLASSPANLTKKFFQTDPATMQKYGGQALPMLGGAMGGPIGASLGEVARQMTGTVLNPDAVPKTPLGIGASVVGAGVAQEPKILEAIPGVSQAKNAISGAYQSAKPGIQKTLSKVGQMLTGKSAAKVGRIIKDPTAILPEFAGGAKSVEDASAQYADALANTTVTHPGEQYVTRGLEKKAFGPFSRGKSEAEDVAQTVYDKWQKGEPVSAQEAFNAKRATDKLWPAVVKERNAEDIRELSEFKTGMDDVLSNQAGEFSGASKDYARARLKSDFTQVLPRTKTGDISTVKSLLLPMLDPKRLPFLAMTSPAMLGMGNLAAQGTMKGLQKLSDNPAIRQALLGVLQNIMKNKQQQPRTQ